MSIPFSSTTISVLRSTDSDLYTEPTFDGSSDTRRVVVANGIRAQIARPAGLENQSQGEQSRVTYKLLCDPVDVGLNHLDAIRDESTGVLYEVQWAFWYGQMIEHWEAALVRIEGLL